MNQKIDTKTKVIRSVIFGLIVLLMITLTIYLFPKFMDLRFEENRQELKSYIDSLGFWGWLLAVGVQVLQVVIAILPGEPIEIAMGMIYGPIIGMLTCLLGIVIGTLIIYMMAKMIGVKFIGLFVNPDKFSEFRFINSAKKKDTLVFTLFFIPGTPKDVLTYFAPFIKMPMLRFIFIATFARIPSVITSTWLGNSLSEGEWGLALIIFTATLIIALAGILINKAYLKKQQDITKEHSEHM